MKNKVLVADDCDCISLSVKQILEKDTIFHTNEAKYCDEAYLKIKKAIYDKAPYHLLISELDFKNDYRNTKLNSGEELILAIKKIQPNIKIIIFSDEVKSFRIESLFKDHNINAFVYKGRNSVVELEKAIQAVFVEEIKPESEFEALYHKSTVDITEIDITLLKLLSFGYTLKEISKDFKKLRINPSSESSIEKSINKLRIHFNARNTVHLIAVIKDLGLI
jgi:DNA-binding NarL/FixJ family response regulator